MTPKVSVIVPTYNSDRYVVQAVGSVLAQTYPNYELIVVDDGSTDNTHQVLKPYFDQLRYVYQNNQGVAAARNRGIELATGEFIAFLDADDVFLPEKLAKEIACFEKQPELDMVISGWRIVNEHGEAISDVRLWEYAPQLDLKTAVLYKPARPSSTILRREWCKKVNGFDARFVRTDDLDFLLKLLSQGCKADWLPEITIHYRQHGKSLMSQGMALVKDTQAVMENFFSRKDLPPDILALKNQESYQSLVWLASRMHFDSYPQAMTECLQQSLAFTPFSSVQTSFHWLQEFRGYAQAYGHQLDTYTLINSDAWQQAIPLKFSNRQTKINSNHILLYSDDPGVGGIWQYNHAMVSHLADQGYQVTHVHYRDDSPWGEREKELGVRQVDLDYHAGNDLTRTMKDMEGAKKVFLDTEPGLIIFSDGWPFSNLAAKQAALEMGIPYIIVLGFIEPSCVEYDYKDGVDYQALATYQYSKAQSVVTVSQENLRLLRKLFQLPDTVGEVIHYGRPQQYFTPALPEVRQRLRQEFGIPADAVVYFSAARFEPIKGYQYQVEAIRQLKESSIWPKLYFVWAGTGAQSYGGGNEEEIKQVIAQLGVTDKVKFIGQRWDIPDWLDASDIFILPSEAEGMPLSIMEAMGKGLPVIASAVSGIPEELGDTGKLLPDPNKDPEATIRELVSTLQVWVSFPQLRSQVGQACNSRAKNLFQQQTMLDNYTKLIQEVLKNNSSKVNSLTHLNLERISPTIKQFKYTCCVWSAWYWHCQDNQNKTDQALQKAFNFTGNQSKAILFDWLKSFSRFCEEKGDKFDSYSFLEKVDLVS